MTKKKHIKDLDKATANEIKIELDNALKVIEDKFNIKLSLGTLTYYPTHFKASVKGVIITDSTHSDIPADVLGYMDYLNKYHTRHGIPKNKIGKWFTVNGNKPVQLVGYNPRFKDSPLILATKTAGSYHRGSMDMFNKAVWL